MNLRPLLALRMALRGLRRDASTTVLSVAILALGLAAPATFASFLVGAIRPLPVPEGERVMRVEATLPTEGGRAVVVGSPDLESWAGAATLEEVAAFRPRAVTWVDRTTAATRAAAAEVSPEAFSLLRVEPRIGRVPSAEEGGSTVLLGHALWAELYDADPGVLGRAVEVDGIPRTVVGVMPEGFQFPFKQDLWLVAPARSLAGPGLEVMARLADGATAETASAELQGRWRQRDSERVASEAGAVVVVRPFTAGRGEGGEAVAFLGLVLVGVCLLLIACANVANLLLVRATERIRSLGVQAALGAARVQLGAQLLLEALALAAAGGAVGVLLASVAVRYVQEVMGPENFGYYWMRMAVDGPVLVFVGVLVGVTALVAGILPVVRVLRADVQRILKDPGAGGAVGGGGRWSRAFVGAQLALSCAALMAAGLTARSMAVAGSFGDALPSDEILVAGLHLGESDRGTTAGLLLETWRAEPEVRMAALAVGAPGGGEPWGPLELEGVVYERPRDRPSVMANAVTPDFFALFDLELRAGRAFGPGDRSGAEWVAVVNESFAAHFADGAVLGRRYRVPAIDSAWVTVVGVVEDAELGGGPEVRADRIYLAFDQVAPADATVLLRADGPAGGLAAGLRSAVATIDPSIPVSGVRTLADLHDYITRAPATLAFLGASGGFAGLIVAAVGLYGLLAFRVKQRRRELGIRLALGADGARLAREVLGVAWRQLAPATAIGLAMAWLVGPVLRAMLLGGNPRDPVAFVVVGASFLLVGGVAALVPALRAARTDPARALASE